MQCNCCDVTLLMTLSKYGRPACWAAKLLALVIDVLVDSIEWSWQSCATRCAV